MVVLHPSTIRGTGYPFLGFRTTFASCGSLLAATVRAVYVSSTLGRLVLFDDVVAGKDNNIKVGTGTS